MPELVATLAKRENLHQPPIEPAVRCLVPTENGNDGFYH